MTRKASFDRIAWLYDPLVRLVFGTTMRKSQVRFLDAIRPGSAILILGGGTGWILDDVFARTRECRVYYVENSRAMMERARKHAQGFDVAFIAGSWEQLPDVCFDVVITHYFLDLFSDTTLKRMCEEIRARLKNNGAWLVSDFVISRWWHRIMIWVMYRFFRISCKIEGLHLPDWEEHVAKAGFISREHAFFYGGFMKSVYFVREGR